MDFHEACLIFPADDEHIDELAEDIKANGQKVPIELSYSTRDAYLEMIEDVYNFGRQQLLGIKAEATMVMRDRSAAKKT